MIVVGFSLASIGVAAAADLDPMQRARALRQEGKLPEAAAILEPHVRTHPDDLPARLLLTDVRLEAGDFPQALVVLEPVRVRTDDDPAVLRRLALIYEKLNRHGDLAGVLDGLALQEGDPPALLLELAAAHGRQGNLAEQAAALDRYLVKVPSDLARWEALAGLRRQLNHPIDEMLARRRLTELMPGQPEGWIQLGDALVRLDRIESAVTAYEAAAALDPENTDVQWKLVSLYAELDAHDKTRGVLERLAQRAGGDPRARDRIARLMADAGQPKQAADILEPAVRREPSDTTRRLRLATYLADAYYLDEAILEAEALLTIAPSDADAQRLLAGLYPERDQYFEADALYSSLLAADAELVVDEDLMLKAALVRAEVAPSIALGYQLLQDSTGRTRHGATLLFAHTPVAAIRYRIGYNYSYHIGRTETEADGEAVLQQHTGLLGLDWKIKPRSILEADTSVSVSDLGPFFAGVRLGFLQTADMPGRHELQFRAWLAREFVDTAIDAMIFNTVRYFLGTSLDLEPVKRWRLGFDGGYGRYIHTDPVDGTRRRNNSVEWSGYTGVVVIGDPVSLTIDVEYTGQWFQESSRAEGSRIPYFAPSIYQTLGLPITLSHIPHWRVEYQIFVKPTWLFEDEALQVSYGGELRIRLHPMHRLDFSFQRTDTAVGEATRIFQENSFTFTYTGAF